MRVSSFLQFRHLYLCAYFVSGCYYSIDTCITIFMYLKM
ncbi:rCG62341 [Rattus norvegicus]|uniref:RCG62341 n=1 Tax=Rattus norvegicus TaxID=10116 RepID=A6HBW6_RAT|nr:rCG62341 [Rattus norvegicus]